MGKAFRITRLQGVISSFTVAWNIEETSSTGGGEVVVPNVRFLAGESAMVDLRSFTNAGLGSWELDPTSTAVPTSSGIRTATDARMLFDAHLAPTTISDVKLRLTTRDDLQALTLRPAVTGAADMFAAGVLLEQGELPEGKMIASPDDIVRGAVLNRYPDGSARAVCVTGVVATTAGVNRTIRLRAIDVSGTNLTAGAVSAALSNITLNCGATGTATITNFGSPSYVWYASPGVFAATYRAAVGAQPALELVVGVLAFGGGKIIYHCRIENGKVANASAATCVSPASLTYGATLSVNGSLVYTLPSQQHISQTAWDYVGTVGGNLIPVTHGSEDLARTSIFPRIEYQAHASVSTNYAGRVYAPFAQHDMPGFMGSGGDHPTIGFFPEYATAYLASGNPDLANATIVNARALQRYPITFRDGVTGHIPSFAQVGAKSFQGGQGWDATAWRPSAPEYKTSHTPAAPLVAWMLLPSPLFIEQAMSQATWHGTNINTGYRSGALFRFDDQLRTLVWAMRDILFASMIAPTGHPWTPSALDVIEENSKWLLDTWDIPNNTLKVVASWTRGEFELTQSGDLGLQNIGFMHPYATRVFSAIERSGLVDNYLSRRLADWLAQRLAVRSLTSEDWRYIPYKTTIGKTEGLITAATFDPEPTWALMDAWYYTSGTPASGPGVILEDNGGNATQDRSGRNAKGLWGAYYPEYWIDGIAAAADRGAPNAIRAWEKWRENITNWNALRATMGSSNPNAFVRWGGAPRWL